MGHKEEIQYDLTLVSTYLPFIVLAVRATLLVSYMFMVRAYVDFQVVFVISCGFVYLDAWFFRRNVFDRTCGHLCVCAVATLVQSHHCSHSSWTVEYNSVLLWICDLTWGVLSGFDVVSAILGLKTHVPLSVKIMLLSILASTHTHLQCSGSSYADMLSRTMLYIVLCAMLIFCGPLTPNFDRNVYNNNVLHVCSHIFFVHSYIVIGSVLIITSIHAHLIYNNLTPCKHASSTEPTPDLEINDDTRRREVRKPNTESVLPDHELLMKLQQAKAANGMS